MKFLPRLSVEFVNPWTADTVLGGESHDFQIYWVGFCLGFVLMIVSMLLLTYIRGCSARVQNLLQIVLSSQAP